MRVTTLIYGLAILALAALLIHRHDHDLVRCVLCAGMISVGIFTILDIYSTWGVVAPPRPTLREQILETAERLRQKETR